MITFCYHNFSATGFFSLDKNALCLLEGGSLGFTTKEA